MSTNMGMSDSHRAVCPECNCVGGAHLFHCSRVAGTSPQSLPFARQVQEAAAVPLHQLTEADVRRIVREELNARDPMVLRK